MDPVSSQPGGGDLLVSAYMSTPARVLTTGSSLADAFGLMERHGIRHIPIVDLAYRLVGVVSDRDAYLAKRERGIEPEDVTVEEVMTPSPFAVSPQSTIEEAASVMLERKLGCAVVVADQKVVGVLSTVDVVRALIDHRQHAEGEWAT